jgi:cytochrome P450
MQWLLEQPDNILSVSALHYDLLEGDYGFTDPHLLKDPYHEHVVHRSLARRVGPLVMDIWDEMQSALDTTWGLDTENWKDICVFDNMMIVIARASNRLFLGLPLCRNTEYLTNMGKFAMDIVLSMTLLRFVPRILKPIVGPIITLPNHYHYRKTAKHTIPLIKERLANMERKRSDPTFDWSEPNDYITWHISIATTENNLLELTPDMISRRLMPLNFAAIHTTVFTITNTFFDLIASDPSKGYLEGIREEAARIYAECGGTWTKAALAKMIRTDSAIRESMRVSNFLTRGVMRKVMSPEGISNKAEGWSAPQNAYIGLDVHSVQHDPDIYPHPDEYDAFRFSRPWEDVDSKGGDTRDSANILKLKNTGLITTSDTFLPFGHGRHAWFVPLFSQVLLMLMAVQPRPLLRVARAKTDDCVYCPKLRYRAPSHTAAKSMVWSECCPANEEHNQSEEEGGGMMQVFRDWSPFSEHGYA